VALLSALPSLIEGSVLIWGARQGFTGKALRDGLDFWAGGFLLLHHRVATLFNLAGYEHFITGAFGRDLPVHMWSYPPNYLLLAACFGCLPPWPAVLAFDALSLLLLVFLLRLAKQPWLLVLAVAASPVALENLLEGQNAALMTALIGGGLLLLETRPRLGGALIGLAAIKPQLGLVLPFHLLRLPAGFAFAVLSTAALGLGSLLIVGPASWAGFWHVTRPATSGVLLTGKPAAWGSGGADPLRPGQPLSA
jgi:alpha-1,2-mannosyltransferase